MSIVAYEKCLRYLSSLFVFPHMNKSEQLSRIKSSHLRFPVRKFTICSGKNVSIAGTDNLSIEKMGLSNCKKICENFKLTNVTSVIRWYRKSFFSSDTNSRKHFEEITDSSSDEWDIIVSGGGMVGTAMACTLGYSDYLSDKKILLLESGHPVNNSSLPHAYSNKVVSVTPGTKELLNSFGAWKIINEMRVKAVKRLQVFEACSDALIVFQHPGMSEDISYIVEQNVIMKALTSALSEIHSRVQVMNGTKVLKYEMPSMQGSTTELVTLILENGKKLKTKLLIGADGVNSLVRRAMSVKYVSWSYHQKAIVATLKLSELTENTVAWQNFLPTGPIALLPLTDDMSSLVWSTSVGMADDLMKMSDDAFVDALNSAMWDQSQKNPLADTALSAVSTLLSYLWPERGIIRQLPPSVLSVEEGSRACFPLGFGHACHYASPRVVLVGDSAHRVHPLAGLGVNLGFGDVQCLTKILEESVYAGNDIGLLDPLLQYETKRQRELLPVLSVIDGFHRLYLTTFTPVVIARSVGLQLTNTMESLKEKIIRCASL